jgi:hypothetical protein
MEEQAECDVELLDVMMGSSRYKKKGMRVLSLEKY